MRRHASTLILSFLTLVVSPAQAAPNLVVQITPQGLLVASTGGSAGVCTVDFDISSVVEGVRVARHFSLDTLVIPARAQPIVLLKLPALVDIHIESAVTAACN